VRIELRYGEYKIQTPIDLLAVSPRRSSDRGVAGRRKLFPPFRRKLWLKEWRNICRRSARCRTKPEAAGSYTPADANCGGSNSHASDEGLCR
jgi:hypothetical protein